MLEIMLTLSLILVLTSVTLPALFGWQARMPLQRAETAIRHQCLGARIDAIRSGVTWMVSLPTESRPGFSATVGSPATDRVPLKSDFESDIRSVQAEDFQGRPLEHLLFYPGGTTSAARIIIQDHQGSTAVLRLDRLTGMVTLEEAE
ncbi:MAG: hypothetical protein MK110_18465 [Fuerstiella sp.]|nr:hypothetical protein [Fuerstiella sp.]